MYELINTRFLKLADNKSVQRVEICCDTEADLPTAAEIADKAYAAYSVALIADTHEIRILNSKGEWV